jgi:hypothetical protein
MIEYEISQFQPEAGALERIDWPFSMRGITVTRSRYHEV